MLGEVNVHGQILSTMDDIGYIIVDVEAEASKDLKKTIGAMPHSIKTRVLY